MTDQIDHGRASGASDTTTGNAAVADLGAPPSLAHLKDVLDDATLSVEQKRSIFASWLSDVHAVPGAPRWRELENGAFVDIHEVEDALRVLDDMEGDGGSDGYQPLSSPFERRKQRKEWLSWLVPRKGDDDDDDPPPSPVAVGRPVPPCDWDMGATGELTIAA